MAAKTGWGCGCLLVAGGGDAKDTGRVTDTKSPGAVRESVAMKQESRSPQDEGVCGYPHRGGGSRGCDPVWSRSMG